MSITVVSCKKKKTDSTPPAPDPRENIINLSANKQLIRGFGAATVFRPTAPLATDDLDKLFGTGQGQIGLSILRIRVASDTDPAWRAIELANAQGAEERDVIVIATPWSPPARMKTNNSLIGGSLKIDSFAAYATYLNDFATYMAANNARLYGISLQNEPDIQVTYESCDWTATQLHDFVKNNGAAITATNVMAAESFNFNHSMTDPILNDDGAAANVDIIGGHIYGGGLADYPLARSKGKELWTTEHLDTLTTWTAVMGTAKEIHDCLTVGNFNAYVWWYAKRFYGPLGEDGTVTKRGYVMSNFARFVRPGYSRVEVTPGAPSASLYLSAYKGTKAIIVAINSSDSDSPQKFFFQGGSISSVTPYTTSQSQNLLAGQSLAVAGNSFTYTLPRQSITTFVEN